MKRQNLLQSSPIIATYPNRGKNFVKGQGNYLIDDHGQKYLDLITGFGVNIFGHNQPHIINTIWDQLKTLTTLHGSFANNQRSLAAKRLVNKIGGDYQVYFGNSGTEAIEAALKFAKLITRKSKFVSFTNAYHGKSLAALSINGSSKYTKDFRSLLPKHLFATFGQIKEVKTNISSSTAAIICEPIQGEAGINKPKQGFLTALRNISTQNNLLLIVDEIQTGLGRTGKFLASDWEQVKPDIVCLGKGLGGTIPASATLVHKKFVAKIPKGAHTSTLGGNPLACAGINATLDLLTNKAINNNLKRGNYFLNQLNQKIRPNKNVTDIRGKGLMIGVEINSDLTQTLKQLQAQKILASPAGEKVIRFLPPYTITKQEINYVVNTLTNILSY